MEITQEIVSKVLSVVDSGLTAGLGVAVPGKMCVEAAICYALDLPHGDTPSCVLGVIRNYKIGINDSVWSSNEIRAKGMRRAAVAQLGSIGLDSQIWLNYVIEQIIRRILPIALFAAAELSPGYKDTLVIAADRCKQEGTKASARAAADAAAPAARAAADAAVYAAAAAAAYAAAYAAADVADVADAAARAAAYAAAARADDADKVLFLAAEICVEGCILIKTEGSKFLYLT